MGGIPEEHMGIIKTGEPAKGGHGDARKRPARPRGRGRGRAQRKPVVFVSQRQMEKTRTAFIAACRGIALDAASTCHRLLL